LSSSATPIPSPSYPPPPSSSRPRRRSRTHPFLSPPTPIVGVRDRRVRHALVTIVGVRDRWPPVRHRHRGTAHSLSMGARAPTPRCVPFFPLQRRRQPLRSPPAHLRRHAHRADLPREGFPDLLHRAAASKISRASRRHLSSPRRSSTRSSPACPLRSSPRRTAVRSASNDDRAGWRRSMTAGCLEIWCSTHPHPSSKDL
ncbi:unnamed protein product, partial [Urochloa humidicola]